jgi:hypothetical protein
VEHPAEEHQEEANVVMLPKPFPPQENGVEHAHAVNHHSEQEQMSVSEPIHVDRLDVQGRGASDKW